MEGEIRDPAELLNRDCRCIAVDETALHELLRRELPGVGVDALLEARPSLFAPVPAFVEPGALATMTEVVTAVEEVVSNPAYRASVLAAVPSSARVRGAPRGALYSFDFHLAEDGPRLIEINSNAGGALLGAYAAHALRTIGPGEECGRESSRSLEHRLLAMFLEEWREAGRTTPLRTVAIVDDEPEGQYLYPEMLLFETLFRQHGISARVVDASQLTWRDDRLELDGAPVDLVYNRLTDFYLERPEHTPILRALGTGSSVVTPNPAGHALYASKANLVSFSRPDLLRRWGVSARAIETLRRSVPRTVAVTADNHEALWQGRRDLFFKPVAGYGSRGAYRGAKLTRRVWRSLLDSPYVAQELVDPTERVVEVGSELQALKLDLRCFVYAGHILGLGARLYRGQTTNLRTAGGGLTPVLLAPGRDEAPCARLVAS